MANKPTDMFFSLFIILSQLFYSHSCMKFDKTLQKLSLSVVVMNMPNLHFHASFDQSYKEPLEGARCGPRAVRTPGLVTYLKILWPWSCIENLRDSTKEGALRSSLPPPQSLNPSWLSPNISECIGWGFLCIASEWIEAKHQRCLCHEGLKKKGRDDKPISE